VLLPVNLAGVLKSLEQAVTSKKIPFARTPKVKNRTAAPLLFVVAPYLIVAFSGLTLWRDVLAHNWGNAAFANIGLWNSLVDVWLGMTTWLNVERKPRVAQAKPAVGSPAPALDWRAVIYHGYANGEVPAGVHLASVSRQAGGLS
jgi:cellulose synthase (UDP-forming)